MLHVLISEANWRQAIGGQAVLPARRRVGPKGVGEKASRSSYAVWASLHLLIAMGGNWVSLLRTSALSPSAVNVYSDAL